MRSDYPQWQFYSQRAVRFETLFFQLNTKRCNQLVAYGVVRRMFTKLVYEACQDGLYH